MKVGIMGAGPVGGSFGKALTKVGHHVMFSSRTPHSEKMQALVRECGASAQAGTPAQTLAFSEVIAVAMHWDAIPEMIRGVGSWSGKIVIDMTNNFQKESPISSAQELAHLTGGRVVKAFNIIGAEHYQDPNFGGQPASMLIAGDDAAAKKIVMQLASDIGFEVIDVGNLDAAAHLENLAALWVQLAHRTPLGRNMAFKVIRK